MIGREDATTASSDRRVRTAACALLALLALAASSLVGAAHAAVGAGMWVEGGSPATIERGDSVELSWFTVDASTVEGWVHQDLQRVDVPGWSGPLAAGGMHETVVTVDLPPGLYYFVVEATDGEQTSLSSIAVIVLAAEDDVDDGTGSDEDPVIEDSPPVGVETPVVPPGPFLGAGTGSTRATGGSGPVDAGTGTRFPDRAPRAGRG